MASQNLLIMNLLRIITPEEIAEIATKHNGGKFLSLTDLVNERVDHKIYRDFSGSDSIDLIHEEHSKQHEESAKILPFNKSAEEKIEKEEVKAEGEEGEEAEVKPRFVVQAITTSQKVPQHAPVIDEEAEEEKIKAAHEDGENMSSFIMIEKSRLKRSQKSLKQKEIIDLYQKNSNVDVEQIKATNQAPGAASEAGVLINKKQY